MFQTFVDIVEAPDDFHIRTVHIHVGPPPGGETLQNMAEETMPSPIRQKPVYRFAPSPNGSLHLGHALSALLNHDMALENGGRFLLRMEDIDQTRCTPELEQAIYDDLGWLGLDWERPVRRQSEHFDDYRAALDRLVEAGLAYPAFLSRGETKAIVRAFEAQGTAWPRDPDGAPLYPAIDRQRPQAERAAMLASGRQHAWRLDMEKAIRTMGKPLFWRESGNEETGDIEALPALWGDVVLSRSDAPSSYHLSVVVDDALQGITHVVRGMDLFYATAIHRLLQQLLDLPQPGYHHHRLILGADGRKLSKSDGSNGLAVLRAEGKTSSDIRRLVGLL
jgi:glutamyl-Q tRNA(Asp) synthetase